jgi:inorganic pyrophosphatase
VKINLFADDTLLYVAMRDVKEAENIMNEELGHIFEWLCKLKLKLNTGKTKMMVLTNKTSIN